MKKTVAVLLFIIMTLSLLACAEKEPQAAPASVVVEQASTSEPTPKPTPEPTSEPTPEPDLQAINVYLVEYNEPIVIMDNEYVTVSVLARYEDRNLLSNPIANYTKYELGFRLHVINKTDNYYLSPSLDNVSINGIMYDNFSRSHGSTLVSPQTEAYIIYFDRLDINDNSYPTIKTWEDLVNVRGICKLFFNTDGAAYRKELVKAEFQFE